MHSLEINFLKDRAELEPLDGDKEGASSSTGSQSNLAMIVGGAIMLLLPAIVFGYASVVAQSNETLQKNIDDTQAKINQKKAENQAIAQKTQQLQAAIAENTALVSVFTQIKPWSALMQDISDRIPAGVQITSIQERADRDNTGGPIQLDIRGTAQNQGSVNDFLLTLQESKFLAGNKTRVDNSRIIPNPIQVETGQEDLNLQELGIKTPDVVEYNITTELNNTPASELLEELSRKGAVGLVRRIKILQEKGAIETK